MVWKNWSLFVTKNHAAILTFSYNKIVLGLYIYTRSTREKKHYEVKAHVNIQESSPYLKENTTRLHDNNEAV